MTWIHVVFWFGSFSSSVPRHIDSNVNGNRIRMPGTEYLIIHPIKKCHDLPITIIHSASGDIHGWVSRTSVDCGNLISHWHGIIDISTIFAINLLQIFVTDHDHLYLFIGDIMVSDVYFGTNVWWSTLVTNTNRSGSWRTNYNFNIIHSQYVCLS